LSKFIHTYVVGTEKNVSKKFALYFYVIFKTLYNINNIPKGENSPNLVSLVWTAKNNELSKKNIFAKKVMA
jgi:hypothetical protein